MAARSLFSMISPDAGKISPGIMSAPSKLLCPALKFNHASQCVLADRVFGEKPKPDAGCMKHSGGESKACRIRNDTNDCGLGAMGVAVKECEKPRDHCTHPNRRLHRERDEHSQNDD